MSLLAIAVCAVGLAVAQAPPSGELPKWVLDLSRIKRHARETLERLPNYTCHDTIERYQKRPNRDWEKVDTLKFEVAKIGNKELYGAPGSNGFEFDDLGDFIRTGFIGTGSFSATVSNIFINDNARFTWLGEDHTFARSALNYGYEIPAMLGGFHLRGDGKRATVGVQGSFWVDAESLDLLRLTEKATGIPVELGMLDIGTTIDYARVKIGASEMLLPKTAEQIVTNLTGLQNRNDTAFSDCREFTSDSLIHFELPAPGAPKKD
jgi:hypothetical protein